MDEETADFGEAPWEEDWWDLLLGPQPPPHHHDEANRKAYYRKGDWPEEDNGPLDGVFLHRWLGARAVEAVGQVRLPASLRNCGPEAGEWREAAETQAVREVRQRLRQDLLAGVITAFAIHPETGRRHEVPKEVWQAAGGVCSAIFWSGRYQLEAGDGAAGDVFLRDLPPPPPDWWPLPAQLLKVWCAPDGTAEKAANERLAGRGCPSPSERKVCQELSDMWHEAGREGGSLKSIQTARSSLR